MTLAEIASFVAVLLAAYATYRNSISKAEQERLNMRVVELEKRLADSEQRANDNERKAIEYREDVIKLGEQMERERKDNTRCLAIVAQDADQKIKKVVFALEMVIAEFESTMGRKPEVDFEALKRLAVIDHITGQLGPIDVEAVKNYTGR